ncbi:MAG TPA: hypothetical protein VJ983_10030 [candidate division Zixibacteria bacterium]|nr:hypothetical protein [candidate division Zixibacteria bacterium]
MEITLRQVKLVFAIVCGLVLGSTVGIRAERKIQIDLQPTLGYHSGKTSYEFLLTQTPSDTVHIYAVQSKLEFPTDATLIGANFRIRPLSDLRKWNLRGSIFTNVTDPKKVMTDSDWESASGTSGLELFSYTESGVQMSMINVDVNFSARLFRIGSGGASLLAGVQFERINQDIIGFSGWYKSFDSSTYSFRSTLLPQSGSGTVLTYRLTRFEPYGGVQLYAEPSSKFEGELNLAAGPVRFTDRDDHLLRHKLSTADGNGLGLLGSIRGDILLTRGRKYNYLLALSAKFEHASITGTQQQTWYADETVIVAPGDTVVYAAKGTTIGGLPHDLKYDFIALGVMFGIRF